MRGNFDLFDGEYDDTESDSHSTQRLSPVKTNGHAVSYYMKSASSANGEDDPLNPVDRSHYESGYESGAVGCIGGTLASGFTSGKQNQHPPDSFVAQVTKTIGKTQKSLQKRSRLIHIFYIVALPLYTVLGALVFKALDGDADDEVRLRYEMRCVPERERAINLTSMADGGRGCADNVSECEEAIRELDACFRNRTYVAFPTLSMNDFTNAVIYATSVYTTIGYGNIAATTDYCRAFTILYAMFGIPLFFAFLKDMGQLFSHFFIKGWRGAGRIRQRAARHIDEHRSTGSSQQNRSAIQTSIITPGSGNDDTNNNNNNNNNIGENPSLSGKQKYAQRKLPRVGGGFGSSHHHVREQRKVFIWAVMFLCIYLVATSFLFEKLEEDWDFFTAFYFLFTSVALVGFGDIFPSKPNVVLANFLFIVLGIVLFGMCYFILQEEIREKAFAASRRVRNSIHVFRRQQSFKNRSMSFDHHQHNNNNPHRRPHSAQPPQPPKSAGESPPTTPTVTMSIGLGLGGGNASKPQNPTIIAENCCASDSPMSSAADNDNQPNTSDTISTKGQQQQQHQGKSFLTVGDSCVGRRRGIIGRRMSAPSSASIKNIKEWSTVV